MATGENGKVVCLKMENKYMQKEMDREILNMTVKPENARKVLDVLYDEPTVNRKKLVELTGITESTIKNIINNFVDKGILVETTGYTRN